jgi:integrase/recombinase XerD
MKCVINDQVVLSRPLEGSVASQIGLFAISVREQGYRPASIHRRVLLAACFSRWLNQNRVELYNICSDDDE